MLHAEHLTLAVPGRTLCEGLTLTIGPGQCWAILGSNGSGKTTLLNALGGLRPPHNGTITLDDKPLAGHARDELARCVGMLLQDEPGGFWGNVLEYATLGRFPHGDHDQTIALAALRQLGLESSAQHRYSILSGGERQRARIAQLLVQTPRVLLLDEPLQHLDLRHQAEAMALFRDLAVLEGRTVVMAMHEPWWAARFCSHALLMHSDGTPTYGTTTDILTPDNLERLYGYRLPAEWAGIAQAMP